WGRDPPPHVGGYSCSTRGAFDSTGKLFGHNPDVSVKDWVAVPLQLDAAATWTLRLSTSSRTLDLLFVVDEDAVLFDRGDGVFDFLAIGTKLRGLEIDVIGLPGQGWKAHVHLWRDLRIDRAAFVVLAFKAE